MTLPVALLGTDLIGQARTGTGKTLGFGIPLLQRTISPGEADYEELAAPGKPQALVVTPTRELTIQVAKDLTTASTVRTVRILTIYGGVAYDPQLDQLKAGVDVVVGTPGRLLDLANRGVLDLSHVKVLVLDEADEMLDLGFLPDVERILRKTPELRQTMLFSATMPSAVIGLARTHMRHPLNIRAESHEDTQMVPTTAQFVYRAHDLDKPEVVARILQADDRGRVMIFCRTKREASRLTDDLIDRGFKAAAIHGDLNQQARERALTRFRGDKIDVLICTDVAARGIDVEGVTHVINNTCPEDEKAYIHRIGRTGRAGASGIAVTFVDWADLVRWKTINKALDLPYDEPQEIYSTSPELYHDLGIPTGAKGRIKPPREAVERQERTTRDKPSGRRGERDRDRVRSHDGDRDRDRDRVRSHDSEPKADSGVATGGERPARKRPNRNRRRLRSGQPVEGGEQQSTEQKSTEQKSDADVTTKTAVPPTAESSTQAAEAPAADRKPRSRTRRRRTNSSEAGAVSAEQAVTEAPAEQAAAAAPAPAKQAEAPAVQGAVEAPVEQAPAKRATRKRTAKKAAEAPANDVPAVEAPAAEKPAAKKKAVAKKAAEKPAAEKKAATKKAVAKKTADKPVAEKPVAEKKAAVEKAPAKKAAAKKTAVKKSAESGEAPKKAAAKKAAAKKPAAKKAVVKKSAAGVVVPTFTSPE
ncbi:DEAD/DEAH box helicase [Kribbella catacumbae]|uniref:DEAD/DEAH box helicase n=1 Tax=Kribbella catacumbae TaxID=460086 RepID=UPI0003812FA9